MSNELKKFGKLEEILQKGVKRRQNCNVFVIQPNYKLPANILVYYRSSSTWCFEHPIQGATSMGISETVRDTELV